MAVYYDDLFDKQFGAAAKTRVHAIMAIVDEMYSEKDTLKTTIKINTIGVKHAVGEEWSGDWRKTVLGENLPTGRIAKSSPYDANLYVFLTGDGSGRNLGIAGMSTVCDSGRGRRTSVGKYTRGEEKGGDAYTAEVRIYITLRMPPILFKFFFQALYIYRKLEKRFLNRS